MIRSFARVTVIAGMVGIGTAGCLPIPWSYTLAPEIDGRYVDADGRPVAGAQVAVSTEERDSTCARPSLATTTDADGRFRFAAQVHRQSYFILLGFDMVLPSYYLCAGEQPPFRPGHLGYGSMGTMPVVALECRVAAMAPLRTAPLECAERRPGAASP